MRKAESKSSRPSRNLVGTPDPDKLSISAIHASYNNFFDFFQIVIPPFDCIAILGLMSSAIVPIYLGEIGFTLPGFASSLVALSVTIMSRPGRLTHFTSEIEWANRGTTKKPESPK